MANAGTLSVSILARTKKFRSSMKRIRKDLSRFKSRVFSLNSALLATATGGGLGFFIKKQFEAIDQSAKFADVIGLTTKQLAGYQQAAKITGVEQSQLNTGLARFQKNIGDAEDGLSTSVRTLAKLNLKFSDLKNLSTDEQMKLVADRFNGLNNQVDKSNVLLNLFGRSGLALGKLLQEGSGGLNRFQKEAEKLGVAFDRVDAAKVELANDAMTRAREVVTGIGQSIAIELAPKIAAISELFIESATSGVTMGSRVSAAFDAIAQKASTVINFLKIMELGYITIAAASLKTMSIFTDKFDEALTDATDRMFRLSDEINNNTIGNNFLDFIDKADKKAAKLTETFKKAAGTEFTDPTSTATAAKKSTFAQGIDISRVALGGTGSTNINKVTDPQLETTNELLERIARNIGGGSAVLA